jgi:hypothetical protein
MADVTPRAKPTITSVTVTILAGQAVSSAGDVSAGNVTMLLAPVDWTPANISFQLSEDNVTFRDLFDTDGKEVLKAMGPGRAMNVDTSYTAGSLWVKIRSGPRDNPVPQAADRAIILVIQ